MSADPKKGVSVRLPIRPEKRSAFLQLQAELVAWVRANEPDTLFYDYYQSDIDPNSFRFFALFRDDAAFARHRASETHSRLRQPLMECMAEPINMEFYRPMN